MKSHIACMSFCYSKCLNIFQLSHHNSLVEFHYTPLGRLVSDTGHVDMENRLCQSNCPYTEHLQNLKKYDNM